jgi:hypothetical protein
VPPPPARDKQAARAAQREPIRASGFVCPIKKNRQNQIWVNWQVSPQRAPSLPRRQSRWHMCLRFTDPQVATVLLWLAAPSSRTLFLQPTVDKGLFQAMRFNPNDRRKAGRSRPRSRTATALSHRSVPKVIETRLIGSDQLTFSAR